MRLERVFLTAIPIIAHALIAGTIAIPADQVKVQIAKLFGKPLENLRFFGKTFTIYQYDAYVITIIVCIALFIFILIRQFINIKDIGKVK